MKKLYMLLVAVLLLAIMACSSSWDPIPPPSSSVKAITAFSLDGVVGTINETGKTIAVAMPFGTDVTALVATFTTTGVSVKVDSTVQESGTRAHSFTSPVTYTVTAADATTQDYTVTVAVASSSAKAITAFTLAGVVGTINETGKTIAVTMPFDTSVTNLVATFTTTGVSVKVGSTVQESGTTANNFTSTVTYRVTAADTTTQDYVVTVAVASSSAKAITAFSLDGVVGTINETGKTIAVTMPFGTPVTALVATFITDGISVKVGSTVQISVTTANNFTSPVTYTVTAADSSTQDYTVTVTVAPSIVPGAPTIGTATAGNAQATVTFTTPVSDGGSAITGYTVTSSPGGLTGTGTASPIIVTGLTNETAYTFTVTATNAIGTSVASSASNSVTPVTPVSTVTNPTTGKIWMDRNLGATQIATASNDYLAYGSLYQWGRLSDEHQLINWTSSTGSDGAEQTNETSTLSSGDVPLDSKFILALSSPNDWRNGQNGNLWQGVNGVNNPCPSGFRLPTEAELNAEKATWSAPNAAGAFGSLLKLPVAGNRDNGNGVLSNVGSIGYYWSSTVTGTSSRFLILYSGSANMSSITRATGSSVRCIKDY